MSVSRHACYANITFFTYFIVVIANFNKDAIFFGKFADSVNLLFTHPVFFSFGKCVNFISSGSISFSVGLGASRSALTPKSNFKILEVLY